MFANKLEMDEIISYLKTLPIKEVTWIFVILYIIAFIAATIFVINLFRCNRKRRNQDFE